MFLGNDCERVHGTCRDAEFAVSAGRLVDDRQELFQGQSVNRAESDAGGAAVAAIVIDDEQVTFSSRHIKKGGEGSLQPSPTPSFPLEMIIKVKQQDEYVCRVWRQQHMFKQRRVWSIVIR